MKKRTRILQGLLAVVLVAIVLLPVGVALAESFGTYNTVVLDAGYVIGDSYQRHTFIAEGLHWVFYADDDSIMYTSSADAETWATPTKFDDYTCNVSPIEGCCNGSSFALWYNLGENRVDVAFMNVTGLGENIYYQRGRPESDGTIAWNNVQIAVEANTSLTTSHPSICDNTLDYPFIAYMVYDHEALDYSGSVATSTTNDSFWTGATNSTINSKVSLNISTNVLYPSVVPVSAGNVSVTVAFHNGADYVLGQNYLDYDIDTDTWDYPATAQFPLPATSYLDADDLSYHSEVGWAGNLTNVDDVYIVAAANDSVLGQYYFADRYGDPADPFVSDTSLGMAAGARYFCGAIGIRNALGDLRVTAIEETQKVNLYNAYYTQATQTWNVLAVIDGVDATSGYTVESDYDNAGTDYLGSIYYDNNVAYIPDLEYGCYGCTPAPAPVGDAGTTILQLILPLLIAVLTLVIMLLKFPEAGIKGVIMSIALSAIVGAIAFQIVKAVCDLL